MSSTLRPRKTRHSSSPAPTRNCQTYRDTPNRLTPQMSALCVTRTEVMTTRRWSAASATIHTISPASNRPLPQLQTANGSVPAAPTHPGVALPATVQPTQMKLRVPKKSRRMKRRCRRQIQASLGLQSDVKL